MGCISSRHNSQNTIENTSRAECVVCFNEANTVLYPCGHNCVCTDCAMQIAENDKERLGDLVYLKLNIRKHKGLFCPFCRKLGLPAKIFPNIVQDFGTI